jgi:hypothetical protein
MWKMLLRLGKEGDVNAKTASYPGGVGWLLLLALCLFLPAFALAAPPAGTVLFAIGDSRLMRDGEAYPVAKGDAVRPGDRLITSGSGHVHLRMADEAFLSLRPNSALTIQAYRYDPDHPEDNRVKFELRRGVMRSVTGEAGRANKEGFRVNTPVAAIGIRGTDFTVYTSKRLSRAQVYSGGITVSPFNAGCRPQGSGACEGSGAATLRAAQEAGRVLEVTGRDEAARILKGEAHGLVPAEASAGPQYPADQEGSGTTVAGGSPVGDRGQSVEDPDVDSASGVTEAVPSDLNEQESASPVLEDASGVLESTSELASEGGWRVTWGRWTAFAGEDEQSVLQKKTEDQEIAGVNTVFALLRPSRESFQLPTAGVARFRAGSAEAYVQDGAGLTPAQVRDAHLTVDFGKREFQTNLEVVSAALAEPAGVEAAGEVRGDGFFLSHPEASNGQVQGVLTEDLREAGMLFQRQLPEQRKVSGAMHWYRPVE